MTTATRERAQDSPKDQPAINYAKWLCENRIGMPGSPSNLSIIELAIKSIASSRYRDEKWKHPEYSAFCWLDQQCGYAQARNLKLNHLFFMNGDYNEVPEPERKIAPLVPCKSCCEGWKPEEKDGKLTGRVKPCECRIKWCAEVKR